MLTMFYIRSVISYQWLILVHGRNVKAQTEAPLEPDPLPIGKNTVTYEARLLKALLLQLI